MKKHTDIIWGVGFLAVIAVGVILLVTLGGNKEDGQTASLSDSVVLQEWTKGNLESQVTLVEYSDFQCPACAAYYSLTKQLMEEFGDRIKFTYRHFPLRQIHINADLASRATEAAGKQSKFWEMHDLLFENQSSWSESRDADKIFEGYASKIGLNVEQFKSDIKSKEVAEKVQKDYESGVASGVNGTPTFFLNGKKLDNPGNYDQFKTIILQALDAKP